MDESNATACAKCWMPYEIKLLELTPRKRNPAYLARLRPTAAREWLLDEAPFVQIEVRMRLLGSLFRPTSGNLIDELFAASAARKTELVRATIISVACLHEAGHTIIAGLHQIPIEWVNLPRIDNLSSPRRPNETPEEELPGVSVPPGVALDKMVSFLLGGLF